MNIDNFIFLFNNFIGGADDDDLYESFKNINLNDCYTRSEFIINQLKPFFNSFFSSEQVSELKKELLFLIKNNPEINNVINNQLFPFEFPLNKEQFYSELYIILYN